MKFHSLATAAVVLIVSAVAHALRPTHLGVRASVSHNATFGSFMVVCTPSHLIFLDWATHNCSGNTYSTSNFKLNECKPESAGLGGYSGWTAVCNISTHTGSVVNYLTDKCVPGEVFLPWAYPLDKCINWGSSGAASTSSFSTELLELHPAKTATAPWRLAPRPSFSSSEKDDDIDLNEKVAMTIGLKRRNVDKLEKILLEVSDPQHPKYGDHLSDVEMRALISPGPRAVDSVLAWLRDHNITKVTVASHQDGMKFEASRSQLSALLGVQWDRYQDTHTKQMSIRALGATLIPTTLAAVIDVVAGHRGWPRPRRDKNIQRRPINSVVSQQESFNNVTPAVLYATYNISYTGGPPQGKENVQSYIGMYVDAVEPDDLTQFCQTYMPSNPGQCNISRSVGARMNPVGEEENSMDAEYIVATGMGAETWSYNTPGADWCHDLITWSQDVFGIENSTHPNVVSLSGGSQCRPDSCEDIYQRVHEDTMKMGVMGISVFMASGDLGSAHFCRTGWNGGNLAASFPASLPYVTAVGATNFVEGSSGAELAEAYSGGGFSWSFEMPTYQKSAVRSFLSTTSHIPNAKYNANGRATPDVSTLATNFLLILDGKVAVDSGTSASTPSFAGMVTQLNNIRLLNNKTLGLINPLLYQNPGAFNDVTVGNNDVRQTNSGWYAQPGWDGASGLGTPRFDKLVDVVKAINRQEREKNPKRFFSVPEKNTQR